ncbi:P-loop containing nucleoside triphosphate hydrolase protein [Chytridium lagenaria]|nr:P-loop containing nucleoside triphosphate hydrolase protein [Chytridium lagenaria]
MANTSMDMHELTKTATVVTINDNTADSTTVKASYSGSETASSTPVPSASGGPGLALEWNKVSYSVPTKRGQPQKVILSNMDGMAQPGEILAIMGGGCWILSRKSTLLNILAGRVGAGTITGSINVNGAPRKRSTWRKVAAYVEQEEIMYKNLTVTETLRYAAELRLPSVLSKKEKEEKVKEIIAELGLNKCRDTRIGDSDLRGVSGEKRRDLFLDEPTSGLDAFTAVNIVSTVSRVAKARNTTVVMTIHQPRTDILEMCDKILILAAGRTVFFGRLSEALSFFSRMEYPLPPQTNPSDHFIDVATLDQRSPELQESSAARIEKFAAAWESEKSHKPQFLIEDSTRAPNPGDGANNAIIHHGRNFKELSRDPATLGATIGQGIIICIVVGFIFFRMDLSQSGIQNRLGALFFIAVNQTFGVVMPTLAVLPLERLIIKRNALPHTLHPPPTWMFGLQNSIARYFTFVAVICVHSYTAMALGLMIGSGVKNVQVGQIIGPLVIVLFLVFGGNFLNLDTVPAVFKWIQWISLITYTNKALAQNEFKGLTFTCDRPGNCLTNGNEILATFSLNNPNSIWINVLINFGLSCAFLLLGYVFFRRNCKPLLRLE